MTALQNVSIGDPVKVCLFDQEVMDQPGKVFGSGINSKGEAVYLVELTGQPNPSEHNTGAQQVANGHPWVLSVYPEEIRPAT